MNLDRRSALSLSLMCAALLCAATAMTSGSGAFIVAEAAPDPHQSSAVGWIAVEELKEKLSRGEPVAIIDVRSTETYTGSGGKIKGALHVRLRRLRARLAQPPLKDIPRDREVVTYCACPDDQASVRAAELFLAAGFKRVRVLQGGWNSWLAARGQIEPKPRG